MGCVLSVACIFFRYSGMHGNAIISRMVSFEYYGRSAIVIKSIFLKYSFFKVKKSVLNAFFVWTKSG